MKTSSIFLFSLLLTVLPLSCRDRGGDDKGGTDKKEEPKKEEPKKEKEGIDFIGKDAMDFKKGNLNSKIVVEYFADLECGACKAMAPILDQVMDEFPNKLVLVFKNFPKDKTCSTYTGPWQHENSCEAAVAARCVGYKNDKFWEFKAHVFANQEKVSIPNLKTWALQFGLKEKEYDECYNAPQVMARVKKDVTEGMSRNVVGTPTIFVNNVRIYPATKQLIENEVKKHL